MASLSQANLPTPLLVTEGRGKTAKADLRKSENDPFYARLGGCMGEVMHGYGLTLKEFAAELGKNESQIRRQIEGKERPQLEAVFAIERFQAPMVTAMARLAKGVTVETVISVKRSA